MQEQDIEKDITKAKDMIENVYNDGFAEINGREYVFTKATHEKRLKVLSFYGTMTKNLQQGDFSFVGTKEFEETMKIVYSLVLFDNSALSGIYKSHFEEYPEDYIIFVTTSIAVICHPFMQGRS